MCKKNPKHKQRQWFSTSAAAAAGPFQQQQARLAPLGPGGGGGALEAAADLICPHWGAAPPQITRCAGAGRRLTVLPAGTGSSLSSFSLLPCWLRLTLLLQSCVKNL